MEFGHANGNINDRFIGVCSGSVYISCTA